MVKNGTLASTGDRARDQRLAGAGRPTNSTPRGSCRRAAGIFPGSRKNSTISANLLGLVNAGDVLEGDAAMASVSSFCPRLAEAERFARGALHLRDRKIHTPISATNGSQEIRSETNHGTFSVCGRRDRDALVVKRWIKVGSLGA